MLGQGKNIWQAEIDAAAEVRCLSLSLLLTLRLSGADRHRTCAQICDFFRFGAKQVESIYVQQPSEHSAGVWK